jgi:hypothetical protein
MNANNQKIKLEVFFFFNNSPNTKKKPRRQQYVWLDFLIAAILFLDNLFKSTMNQLFNG